MNYKKQEFLMGTKESKEISGLYVREGKGVFIHLNEAMFQGQPCGRNDIILKMAFVGQKACVLRKRVGTFYHSADFPEVDEDIITLEQMKQWYGDVKFPTVSGDITFVEGMEISTVFDNKGNLMRDGVPHHRHTGYDYYHPISRVHREE